MAPEETRRRSFSSVRFRLTLASVLVIGVVLVGVGASLVLLEQRSITSGEESSATSEATAAALALSQGRSMNGTIRPGTGVQVVDASRRVVAGSESLVNQPPISSVVPPKGTHLIVPLADRSIGGDDGAGAVAAATASTASGVVTVYVTTYGSQLDRSLRTLIIGLGVGLPLVLLVAGGLTWILTGRALRPVDRLRAEVDSIAEHDLAQRVEVPAGDDEVSRLAVTLNEMLIRLDEAQTRQRSFVSDASHELRSPIASLLATVEVARAHPERADWPRVAAVVDDEGQRLSSLVDDLLLLAASDERGSDQPMVPVDLDEILLAEAARLRIQGGPSVDASKVGAARALGNADQLSRAIRNLVDNAKRHAHSQVRLSVRVDGATAVVTVADDGPGIDVVDADRLFERFARNEAARDRPSGGTGLGLAIVAEVARSHGGSVHFVEGGPGATAELRLPVAP